MSQDRPDRRSEVELARRQLHAVEAWHRARRAAEEAAQSRTTSREMRMDVTRRLDILREQHRAIVQRTQKHLDEGVHLLVRQAEQRAVLVHRSEWFCQKLSTELARHGIDVVESLANGAEGVGVVVAEQPDVLLVEDTLPMVPGEEVVRETRQFSPGTLVVAQVASDDRAAALLEAGARAAYTRRVPPGDVASAVLELLDARCDPASASL